jgi:uncharacterized membrane protein
MRITLRKRLLLVNILAAALIAVITFVPHDLPRIILGLPFVMFFPGYTLIAALFPRRDDVDSIERVALSFGISVAVVAFDLLILNYTIWGIKLYPILISLMVFIWVTSLVAWQRQRRLSVEEWASATPSPGSTPQGRRWLPRPFSAFLVVAIVIAVGILGHLMANPKMGDSFTEFYLIGLEGKAEAYPRQLVLGEEGRVTAGIINHEHQPVTYSLEVAIDGTRNSDLEPITLDHEDQWEGMVAFTPERTGNNQKVEFLLHRVDQSEVYRQLHIWIDVVE